MATTPIYLTAFESLVEMREYLLRLHDADVQQAVLVSLESAEVRTVRQSLTWLRSYAGTDDAEQLRQWLELNRHAGAADALFRRLDAIKFAFRDCQRLLDDAAEIGHLRDCAREFYSERKTAPEPNIDPLKQAADYVVGQAKAIEARWRGLRIKTADAIEFAQALLTLIVREHFVPSDTQTLILNALDGVALKRDNLCDAIGGGVEVLDGKKNKLTGENRGGLNELTRLGFVLNDRRIGGYFRPDAPPAQ